MTAEEVKNRVAAIKEKESDDEVAHRMEDDLYRDILEFIKGSGCHHSDIAYEALESRKLDFARWCA